MTRGVEFSKASFIAFISIGFIIILVVGLLSGFIARPNNCIEPSTTTSKPAVTTTSSPLASSATNSYATSGSTTASLVSTSTLTTSTTSSFSSSVTTTSVTTTTVTTTTLPTEIAYKLNLASFASIVSITRGIPNKNINVTLIENAVLIFFFSTNNSFYLHIDFIHLLIQ